MDNTNDNDNDNNNDIKFFIKDKLSAVRVAKYS